MLPPEDMVFLSAIAFIVLLTVLILIHELGHFAVARWAGIEVEEFGFGLPPRATTLFRWGKTRFTVNWIPFGGFVRLKGEGALDAQERRARGSFAAASVPARLAVLVAGVVMNFTLAVVLLVGGFWVGRWIPTFASLEQMEAAAARGEITLQLGVLIEQVATDGTAATAGVPANSLLLAVDQTPVQHSDDVVSLQAGKQAVTYTLQEHGAEPRDVRVTLADGKAGVVLRTVPRTLSAERRSFPVALGLATHEIAAVSRQTVAGIGNLVLSVLGTGVVPEGVTGIVGIARLTHASVQEGWNVYLRLVALLSLSLAILNILPFPALDGGRMVFVLYEAITGRPMARRFELGVNSVGFILLLVLILFVTVYDVLRLFR